MFAAKLGAFQFILGANYTDTKLNMQLGSFAIEHCFENSGEKNMHEIVYNLDVDADSGDNVLDIELLTSTRPVT